MKKLKVILLLSLTLASCSDKDEPTPDVYSQISEISNGESEMRRISYDAYGRVTEYEITYPDDKINCTYSYPSENLITIHTRLEIHLWKDVSIIKEYADEMCLENGRAAYCDGIFTLHENDRLIQKKYRQEFTYTGDNHLNVIRCTQWGKSSDEWVLDKPWTWVINYIWENDNLVKVEDYAGHDIPYYTYEYTYSTISGVQNIVSVHFDRIQYYPLYLKGYFGAQSKCLISKEEGFQLDKENYRHTYEYDIADNMISSYKETRDGKTYNYDVVWTNK